MCIHRGKECFQSSTVLHSGSLVLAAHRKYHSGSLVLAAHRQYQLDWFTLMNLCCVSHRQCFLRSLWMTWTTASLQLADPQCWGCVIWGPMCCTRRPVWVSVVCTCESSFITQPHVVSVASCSRLLRWLDLRITDIQLLLIWLVTNWRWRH